MIYQFKGALTDLLSADLELSYSPRGHYECLLIYTKMTHCNEAAMYEYWLKCRIFV